MAKYTTLDFRAMTASELEFNRIYPATDYCSTPKCGARTTHVRVVEYQHYACGRIRNGRRDKKLRLCADCAAKFAASLNCGDGAK